MKPTYPAILLAVALSLCTNHMSPAEEKSPMKAGPQQIDEWVAQLGHERLTERIKAEKQLVATGKEAIPVLAKAALSGNRDTIEKSIDVLGKLAQSKDDDTKEAARITLQMLSESDQPSTAERAKIALNTKEADGIKPFEGWDKAGNPFAGGGQMNRGVSVSNVNGLRTIQVKENGRETTIQELQSGKILVVITGGKEPVEFLANNTEELKQKQPEAAALYEQYASGNQVPGIQLPGFAFGNLVGGLPANVLGNGGQQAFRSSINIQNNGNAAGVDGEEMLRQQLTELKERMVGNPVLQQLLDQQIQALPRK